jgi:hypothetical protein
MLWGDEITMLFLISYNIRHIKLHHLNLDSKDELALYGVVDFKYKQGIV